jgi:uncharacterized phage protein gp47/JayE
MNTEVLNLLNRPYQQVVDDILTSMVGGVVNEQIYFSVDHDRYGLSQTANAVRSINGTVTVETPQQLSLVTQRTFQESVDYLFSVTDNSVVWLSGGLKPDDQSVFFVDYFRENSAALSPLTDLNVGSVVRTLSEAVGREIALVYQQINEAYLAGFVDTATGISLDEVVSILGVTRKTGDYAAGIVTFFRDPAARSGAITIPQGTLLRTANGVTFATADLCTLQAGQARLDIPIRATEESKGPVGKVKAGEINTLEDAITGINRITNFDPTTIGAGRETDAQLRTRAKATLQGLGKGTIAALTCAIFDENGTLQEVRDPNSRSSQADPGTVSLLVETGSERFISLQSRVNETRAAGVQTTLVARFVFFKPRLVITVGGLTAPGKPKLIDAVTAAIQAYVDTLTTGDSAVAPKLVQAILSKVPQIKGAKAIRFADVIAWRADVAKPSTETLVDALLQAVTITPQADLASLRAAIQDVLQPSFSERRIPDRSLVQGPSNLPATDQDIAKAQFHVSSLVSGEKWSLMLDLEPPDILLVEP